MSYWPTGQNRHRTTRPSRPARTRPGSSTSIIAAGAVITILVILGTLALHQADASEQKNRWATPLPTVDLQQPTLAEPEPEPVPVLPAPTPSTPIAVNAASTGNPPGPPPPRSGPAPQPDKSAPAPAPVPVSVIPAAGTRISLITDGRADLRVRHRKFQLRLDRIDSGSSETARSDATFVVRDGLADKGCLSLESVNYPGRFVHHQDFAMYLHQKSGSDGGFDAEATFCAVPVGSAGAFVLRAAGYADGYLTVRDSSLRLSRIPVGDAQKFRTAAGL